MMGHMQNFVPTEQKVSVIHITSYEDKNFQGTLQNAYFEERQVFRNLTQLLFLIESLQDTLQYPQRGMEARRFKSQATTLDLPKVEAPAGETLATFKLQLLFRQNASWQGNVVWMEKGTEAQFRSALELVSLMDSVLS